MNRALHIPHSDALLQSVRRSLPPRKKKILLIHGHAVATLSLSETGRRKAAG